MSNTNPQHSVSVFYRTNATMARLFIFVVVCVTTCVAGGLSAPSHETILSVRSRVKTLVDNWPELGPKLVRLSFHDCVGGCDGCIDLTDGNNWGLEVRLVARKSFNCVEGAASREGKSATAAELSSNPGESDVRRHRCPSAVSCCLELCSSDL